MKPYGTLTATTTSPPQTFTEPITLSEMRTFLRLPDYSPGDPASDALIEAMITAAREIAETERYQNRDLVAKQWDLRLDCFPPCAISLREPLGTVDLVQYIEEDGTTVTLAENVDYIADVHRALVMPAPGRSWPTEALWPSSAVLVRFTTRAPEVPEYVVTGMKLLVAAWHEGRLPFEAQPTVTHTSSGVIGAHTMPLAVEMLLKIGKRIGVL